MIKVNQQVETDVWHKANSVIYYKQPPGAYHMFPLNWPQGFDLRRAIRLRCRSAAS